MIRTSLLVLIVLILSFGSAIARDFEVVTNVEDLEAYAAEYSARWASWRGPAFLEAQEMTSGIFGEINADPSLVLVGVDENGKAIVAKYRNVNAAISTRANLVQVGGVTGYDLDGSTTTGLYHWDGSSANGNHPEFVGRITNGDGSSTNQNHANHTAGTMMASGVSANAKGMASGAHLTSYDWNNDQGEMAIAATQGMKISSHSYGFGDPYSGSYDEWARGYDLIMHDAPHYQAIIAAGNLGSGGFNTLYDDVCGKNSLAVGNVNDVSNYTGPGSVNIASSSSVGPPDDGRVKPDIMGNGVSLYSCTNSGYTTMTGTSMASPNIAGSMFLMYELYEQTHNSEVPLSSTMRAVLFNTADECGSNDGPDYKYGWGLMNTRAACDLIASDELDPSVIGEYMLTSGAEHEYTFSSDGVEAITVTVVWTDPEAALWANPTLINDIDVVVEDLGSGTLYYPWKLNVNSPAAAATTGDNEVDTVEQIWIENPNAGSYMVRVFHEGALQDGQQAYSLVVRGLTGGDAPQFLMSLTPINNYIAPGGGQLTYTINFRHTYNETVPGLTYWNMVTLPNGNPYGPVFEYPFAATPNMQVDQNMMLQIPGYAPGGTYEFIGNIGYFPSTILISDSFEMVKFGTSSNRNLIDSDLADWSGSGFDVVASGEAVSRSGIPEEYAMSEAYPNPFNPTTSIEVSLPESVDLTVQVFNLNGRLVATLSEGRVEAGNHTLTFDGSDLSSGMYFVTATVPGEMNMTHKLVLMK